MVSKLPSIWKQTVHGGCCFRGGLACVLSLQWGIHRQNAPHPADLGNNLTRVAIPDQQHGLAQDIKIRTSCCIRDNSLHVCTGAWQYNRPCAPKYVGKFQSCMVISKWPIHCTRTRIATALLLVLDRLRATDRLRQPTNPTVASSTTALRG